MFIAVPIKMPIAVAHLGMDPVHFRPHLRRQRCPFRVGDIEVEHPRAHRLKDHQWPGAVLDLPHLFALLQQPWAKDHLRQIWTAQGRGREGAGSVRTSRAPASSTVNSAFNSGLDIVITGGTTTVLVEGIGSALVAGHPSSASFIWGSGGSSAQVIITTAATTAPVPAEPVAPPPSRRV